jgi:hypothetical protein
MHFRQFFHIKKHLEKILLSFIFVHNPILTAILYPSQIPASPPAPLKRIELIEKTLPPQTAGKYPPAIDPSTIVVMITDFMNLFSYILSLFAIFI